MAHFRLAQCWGAEEEEEEGSSFVFSGWEYQSDKEGYRRGHPKWLSGQRLEGGAPRCLETNLPPPPTPSDILCSRGSQLSSRSSEITGTSCFLVALYHLTNGETKAGDEMSLPQVAESGSRLPRPPSFMPEQPYSFCGVASRPWVGG